MKKNAFLSAVLMIGLTFSVASCAEDKADNENTDAAHVDYTAENAGSWRNYMYNVAALLKKDATDLYNYWNTDYEGKGSYALVFKNHNNAVYGSTSSCIQEVIEGCITIAGEVGDAKIGDPYNLYMSGQTTEALYAVESWYSWHSRDDYTNNILSVRNAYYGSLDGTVHTASLSALMAEQNASLNSQVKSAITTAASAIQAIPQPFRNNINSKEAVAAMEACSALETVLKTLNSETQKTFAGGALDNRLEEVIEQYVDGVVLPTYKNLMNKNQVLYDAIVAFHDTPSNETFETACEAWLNAREPWEKSEAFLFGPVDAKGLDPNMDSWPLDQVAIVQILNSGNYDGLDWTDNDGDGAVEAAQNVRGFHTLEFLLFKDGKPRKVN